MQHRIDVGSLGPHGSAMTVAVERCVHCGFCLPVCPTYQDLGEETDSPRGRIFLMKEALEGGLDFAETRPFVDRCLGCLACEPACPSGVGYRDLLHGFREIDVERDEGPMLDVLRRRVMHTVLPSPRLFRLALTAARIFRPLRALSPRSWRPMLDMAAELQWPLPRATPLPAVGRPGSEPGSRVALLAGCAQEVLAPGITRSALSVLERNRVEVLVPPDQGCCGSLALHDGEADRARELARRNLEVFPGDVDAILTTAAGCGSGMAGYGALFASSRRSSEQAHAFVDKVRDVSVFLEGLDLVAVPEAAPVVVAYQGACHLEQAQQVSAEPRRLLRRVPGLTLVGLGDRDRCCGSAGTYNLEEPEIAADLGRAKAEAVIASGAEVVASGNVGCIVQMRLHLRRLGSRIPVLHTVEILDRAYRGVDLRAPEG